MATRESATAVRNDVRDAADCPAIDTYRQAFVDNVTSGEAEPIVTDEKEDPDESGGVPAAHSSELRSGPNTDCPPGSTVRSATPRSTGRRCSTQLRNGNEAQSPKVAENKATGGGGRRGDLEL